MIVAMKKVTIIALTSYQDDALHELQSLGLLHIQPVERPAHASADTVREQIRSVQTALQILHESGSPKKKEAETSDDPVQTVREILDLNEKRARSRERRSALLKQSEELAVWGDFNPEQIGALGKKGVQVSLYSCAPLELPEAPEGSAIHEIYRDKHRVAFALVSRKPIELDLPEFHVPDESPETIRQTAVEHEKRINDCTARLRELTGSRLVLEKYQIKLEDELAHADAYDQSVETGPLVYLQGFAPFDAIDAINEAARAHGWGVLVEDPVPGDTVPTLLRNPRWLRPIEAMFDFIDTFPGYRERDISGVFYLAFSLFYAILIGDAGYGAVFLLLTIGVQIWKGASIPKKPLYLIYVLNVMTIIYGILTGTYFGITLPETAFMHKFMVLNSADMTTMLKFCFTIAVIHLSFAHIWNAVQMINSWKALSQVGWTLVVWGAYFLVRMLLLKETYPVPMIYFSGAGLALILLFSGILQDTQILIQLPNSLISCFSDIISYMRLFAVGFSAMKLAEAFNNMAFDLGMNSILAGFMACLILVLGHSLNMAMSLLAVLVHGLRLNVLEFSGHLGMEWSGFKYNPFKRNYKH